MSKAYQPDPFEYDSRKGFVSDSGFNRYYGQEWEETLVDTGASEPRKIKPLFDLQKMKWLYSVVALILVVLLGRLFQLQIVEGREFQQMAYENRYREHILRPFRGVIFDRNKNILVSNVPSFDIAIIPADFPKTKENQKISTIFETLQKEAGVSSGQFEQVISGMDRSSYKPLILKENISRDQALILESKSLEMPGIEIVKTPIRQYQNAEQYAHVLGYIGKISEEEVKEKEKKKEEYLRNDTVGKSGLELSYEEMLRGIYGKQQVEVDSFGKIKKVLATREPVPGYDLILTLDQELQFLVREKLEYGALMAGSKKATAVVMKPKTGEILAYVSIPTFDNNLFARGISKQDFQALIENEDKPLLNRVINGVYPPGSIVKPIIAMAALEENIISDQTTVIDEGKIDVKNKYNPDIVYHFVGWNLAGLGPVNVYSAISRSSDIYFYYLGGGYEEFEGLGAERIYDYYEKFLFGSKTGIDLPSESKGLIPTPKWKEETKNEVWYLGDNYHLAIGQGDLLITPLQAVVFTSTIANGGTTYEPHLLKKAVNQKDNQIIEFHEKAIKEDFLKKSNFEIVKKAMRQTVTDGTAKEMNDLSFQVAGKTGTAQFANNTKTHAWFVGFAPYDDPEVALAVLVEGGGEGNEVAVPIAKEILKWYFSDNKAASAMETGQ